MSTTTFSGGADAPDGRSKTHAAKTDASVSHTPGLDFSPDLHALAKTLIRVAQAAEARDAGLRDAIDTAASEGDLRLVRRLTQRLGRNPSINNG